MKPLPADLPARNKAHMGRLVERAYLKALDMLNVSEVSRETGRAVRTLQAYQLGERRITEAAAAELVEYLQVRSKKLAAAAAALAAALEKEAEDGEAK